MSVDEPPGDLPDGIYYAESGEGESTYLPPEAFVFDGELASLDADEYTDRENPIMGFEEFEVIGPKRFRVTVIRQLDREALEFEWAKLPPGWPPVGMDG